MDAGTAVGHVESVIAASHDVQQAIRRTAVRIVVHAENAARAVAFETEAVPETRGEDLEAAAVAPDAEHIRSAGLIVDPLPVRSDGRVGHLQVLAAAHVNPAVRRPRHAAEAIVRIVALRLPAHQFRLLVAHAVVVGVLQLQELVAQRQVQHAVGIELQAHGIAEALREGRGAPLPRGVLLEEPDAVRLRPLVVGAHLVRVVLHHEKPALRIGRDAHGRVDVRLRGDQFDPQIRIQDLGHCGGRGGEG